MFYSAVKNRQPMAVFSVIPLLLIVLFCGCGKKSEKVIATVGSEKITVDEFNQGMDEITQLYGDFLNSSAGHRQYLDSLVKEKMVIAEAKKEGVAKRTDVKNKLTLLEQKIQEIKQKKEKEIILDEMLKEKASLGDSDVKNYYNQHKEEFEKPFEIRVSHILVNTEDEAARLLERVRKGESFPKLAREFSIEKNTAKEGGDMGFFGRRQFVKEFEDTAFGLGKIGDVSNVVKTPLGYHIIKLTDKRQLPPVKLEDEKVETEIKQILQKEKLDKWLNEISKKYTVRVNEKLLSQPAGTQPQKGEKNEK